VAGAYLVSSSATKIAVPAINTGASVDAVYQPSQQPSQQVALTAGSSCGVGSAGGCGAAPRGGGGCGCGGNIDAATTTNASAAAPENAQDVYIRALNTGSYDKQEVTVKKGIPVRLHFTADPDAGCGRQMVIYGLNVRAISKNGEENIVDFTPQDAGTYEYNCGMRMWRPGRLVVV